MSRKPENRETLLRRGSWRGKSKPAAKAGQYDLEPIPAPAGLSVAAAAVFDKVQGKLIELGCWDSVFCGPLERYCWMLERWTETISRDVVFDSDLNKLNTMLSGLETKFGMNPADRERLHCTRQEPEDKSKMRFFGPKLTS